MPAYNKVILMGHMTRDPQLKHLPSGMTVAEFGIAVNHKWKGKDGQDREEVLFIDCAAFGRGAEVINQYCQKGKAMLVEGRLKFDTWEDKNGGGKRSKHSVVVDNFQLMGGRNDGDNSGTPAPDRTPARASGASGRNQTPPFTGEQEFDESSIPFAWRPQERWI